MPPRPAVLAYWSPARRGFYGGPIVDELAEGFPEVRFLVVGSAGRGEPQHPNMDYLGRLPNLEGIYGQVTALVRIPEHDSLSVMVLEALARGRWAIYNSRVGGTDYAEDASQAADALTGKEGMADILNTAIGLEKQSILFYQGLKDMVGKKLGRDWLDTIIKEEASHVATLMGELKKLQA